jgi:copper(I)-binding protein
MRAPVSWTSFALASALLFIVAACSSGSGAASASVAPAGPTVSDAWVRPPMGPDRPAAGYMTITDPGGEADALVSVSSPIATSVEIHETTADASGMMAMHPIERIDIPAGGSAKLEPGGYHLMLMGVTKMPAVGETVELTLTFEKAGDVVVQAEVRAG